MFYNESRRVMHWLSRIVTDTRIIDIGCGTAMYRTTDQPYITDVYDYIRSNSGILTKLDKDTNTDADIVMDICATVFPDLIGAFDIVLATNILEHVNKASLEKVIHNLAVLLKPKGHLIITVPYNLPLHNRPIDNGLRPSCSELKALLSDYFASVICETWVDAHYREPYLSHPELCPLPQVTGGLFSKSFSTDLQN